MRAEASVTSCWKCSSFSITLQSEISARVPRVSLVTAFPKLTAGETLFHPNVINDTGRQRSVSQRRERSDKWGRLGGIRADESCWALRND